jgi:HrpA-like RNA helicase
MVCFAYAAMTKVILATNIAETSLTFPDVVYVVDGGQVNMATFDPVNNMPLLGPEVRPPRPQGCIVCCVEVGARPVS